MAPHLAPVDPSGKQWNPTSRLFVWRHGGLVNNLGHVAERRLLWAAQGGLKEKPFDFAFGVGEGEVAAFFAVTTDDLRIERLVAGLVLVEPPDSLDERLPPAPLPSAYAVLKPLFVPDRLLRFLGILAPEARLPLTLALVRLLAAGRVHEAVDEGWRRLRIAGVGLPALPRQAPDCAGLDGPRLLAALLIPITPAALARQLRRLTPIDSHTEPLVFTASPTPEGETP
jgi:CRISPR-associated protein Csx17